MAKRIKKYFSSFDDIVDLWATQAQPEARCRNGNYRGDWIYSYGSHYVAARFYTYNGVRVAFVNTVNYSKTTNGHLWSVRGALERAGIMYFDAVDGKFPQGALTRETLVEAMLCNQSEIIDDIMSPIVSKYAYYFTADPSFKYRFENAAAAFDAAAVALGVPELMIKLPTDFWELVISAEAFTQADNQERESLYHHTQMKLPGNFIVRQPWHD